MSRELVGGFDNRKNRFVIFIDQRGIVLSQLLREHLQELGAADIFHLLIGGLDLRVKVLDGGRQIPCEDLRSIVEQSRRGTALRICRQAENLPAVL